MKTATALTLVAATVAISACSGTPAEPTMIEKAQGKLDTIVDADLGAPSTPVMPVAGIAQYEGAFGMGSAVEPNVYLVGTAAMSADFATGTMSGTVDDFHYGAMLGGVVQNATGLDGNLTLNGTFIGTNGLLGVNGVIDGSPTTGLLLTDFKGDNAATLVGVGTGDLDGTAVDMYLAVEQ